MTDQPKSYPLRFVRTVTITGTKEFWDLKGEEPRYVDCREQQEYLSRKEHDSIVAEHMATIFHIEAEHAKAVAAIKRVSDEEFDDTSRNHAIQINNLEAKLRVAREMLELMIMENPWYVKETAKERLALVTELAQKAIEKLNEKN